MWEEAAWGGHAHCAGTSKCTTWQSVCSSCKCCGVRGLSQRAATLLRTFFFFFSLRWGFSPNVICAGGVGKGGASQLLPPSITSRNQGKGEGWLHPPYLCTTATPVHNVDGAR